MAIIEDSPSGLGVDVASRAARVLLYDASGNPLVYDDDSQPTSIKGIVSMGINDGAVRPMRTDRLGSTATANHTTLLSESFEGTTINPQRWGLVSTTTTASQASTTGLLINANNTLTANTGYLLYSTRRFAMSQRQPMQFKYRVKITPATNTVQEFGLSDVITINGVHGTAALIQVTATGVVQPVIYFNGIAITGDPITGLNYANHYTFDIFKDDDQVNFTVQDTGAVGNQIVNKQTIRLPSSQQRLFSSTALSVIARQYVTGTAAPTVPTLIVTDIYAAVLDSVYNLTPGMMQTLQNRGIVNNPLTGAQLAAWANSAEPASATLSNTAAGYSTLGGKFQFAAVAGAVTDYALFGFTVPSPLTLVVTGITIETWNTGAASATTPTLLTWFAVENQAAVSLATATGRVGVGAQDIPVSAAVGYRCQSVRADFPNGLITGPGRFFVIGLRIPVGTATASQVIAGMVNVTGFTL